MKLKKIFLLAFASTLLSITVIVPFVRPAVAQGTVYIRADGTVEPPAAPVSSVDNVTYIFTGNINGSIVVERDNIVVDGAGYTVQGTGNGTGIYLSRRSNVTVKNVRIEASDDGIYVYGSSDNTLSRNNITNNTRGIWLYDSSNNSVCGNYVANNRVGVWLRSSSNNTISGNNITNNYYYGVRLEYSSSSNNISGNNITNNRYYGVYLHNSANNKFYSNNFINNTPHAYVAPLGRTNFWDEGYPSGGNYWSDFEERYPGVGDIYSGEYQNETESDGIWDDPYDIDENNVDNYPLVSEFPTWTSILLLLMVPMVAITIHKRRPKIPIH